jgi:hypothetical protein
VGNLLTSTIFRISTGFLDNDVFWLDYRIFLLL